MRLDLVRPLCALVLASIFACVEQPSSLLDGDGDGDGGSGSNDGGSGSVGGQGSGAGSSSNGGSGGGSIPQTADFTITANGSAALDLRDSAEVELTVAPNGYVGQVSLSLMNVPADVQGSLSVTSLTLDGSSDQLLSLTLESASDTVTGAFAVTVVGTAPEGQASGDVALTIEPVITVYIPQDLESYVSSPANTTAFGAYPTRIKAPPNLGPENTITVRFFNQDSVNHEIHADQDQQGFGHGQGPIAPNSFDPVVRNINAPGDYSYYPHDIGTNILGLISVEE